MQRNTSFAKTSTQKFKNFTAAASASLTSMLASQPTSTGAANDGFENSAQLSRELYKTNNDVTCVSSLREISLIETVTSFLEENGAADIDPKVLRNLAEALSKRVDDTSPGTIHDVTMENSYNGCRSTTAHGNSSPMMPGRSVRDFDEQMSSLRKENFNLKLRIYFMEEKLPGYKNGTLESPESKETLLKQIIDAKIEMEMLRKEIQEKQDLLKEAAQALTQMENVQKETELKSQEMLEEMQQRLQYIQENGPIMQHAIGDGTATADIVNRTDADNKVHELELALAEVQFENKRFEHEIEKLQAEIKRREDAASTYEARLQELLTKNAELLEKNELKQDDIKLLEQTIDRQSKDLESSLTDCKQLLMATISLKADHLKESDSMRRALQTIRDQQETIGILQSKVGLKATSNQNLLERITEYQSVISRQTSEADIMRRENQFFRQLMDRMQQEREYAAQMKYCENYKKSAKTIGGGTQSNRRSSPCLARFDSTCSIFGTYLPRSPMRVNAGACDLSLSPPRTVPDVLHGTSRNIRMVKSFENMNVTGGSGQPTMNRCEHDMQNESFALGTCLSSTSLQTNFSAMSILAPSSHRTEKTSSNAAKMQPVLHKQAQKNVMPSDMQSLKLQLADKTCELQEAEEKLRESERLREHACRTIQALVKQQHEMQSQQSQQSLKTQSQCQPQSQSQQQQQQQNESKESKQSNSHVITAAWESTGICRSLSDTEAATHEFSTSQKQRYELQMAMQEETINQLRAEVKKKTANLQNLVNKELWEKNREIERLTKLVAGCNMPQSPVSQPNNSSLNSSATNELQQSFSDVEYAKAMERNKLLQRKVDILIQRLGADRQQESQVTQLHHDLRQTKMDLEKSEKWGRECADLCTIMANRLEELAGFLNSLLKHKDVLGVLAADRRRAMRRAVDRSLDLSKSLNMTLSFSRLSLPDQSLVQLSNLSEILGDMECGLLDVNHTFNSHEELHTQALTAASTSNHIETLEAENKALKKELEKRRSTDSVRKERRSLPLPMQQAQQQTQQHDNQSESEAWSEPDRKVSLARMGLEDPSSSMAKELSAAQTHCSDSDDSDAQLDASRPSVKIERNRNSERIAQLEQLIGQRDERILKIQCQLVEADNRLKQENLRVLELEQEMSDLRLRNEALHADLIAIGEQDFIVEPQVEQTHIAQLKQEISEKTLALEKLRAEHVRLKADAQVTEMELTDMRNEIDALNVKHEVSMALAAEHEQEALENLRHEMDTLLQQRLDEQMRKHQEALARDWVAANSYEEMKQQLLELQRQYVETLRNIEYHQENEQELKQSLVDSELAARALKKQLDESTLQASKAVMERTKAYNEKLQLEQQVETLNLQLKQLQAAANEQQMAASKQQQCKQERLPSSDVSHSGYTSEEVPNVTVPVSAQRAAVVSVQRMNNSSPDLGIESDAGRVSSVELSNAQHAMLKTVELNAIGCGDGAVNAAEKEPNAASENTITSSSSPFKHDCIKVDQENAELRRKLIRTKRALEDTYEKLRVANKAKAQVEKDIKNQILKTHHVLRNVRSNMENEL